MNAMIANFVVGQDPACGRCAGGRLLPAPKESLAHIWLGVSEKNTYSTFKTSLIVMITNYYIFKSRKSPGIPTLSKYNAFLAYTLPTAFHEIIND